MVRGLFVNTRGLAHTESNVTNEYASDDPALNDPAFDNLALDDPPSTHLVGIARVDVHLDRHCAVAGISPEAEELDRWPARWFSQRGRGCTRGNRRRWGDAED